jgi:hypothetical protein
MGGRMRLAVDHRDGVGQALDQLLLLNFGLDAL